MFLLEKIERLKVFAITVCLCLQTAGLNDSANWPSLNKASDKVVVIFGLITTTQL